MSYQAKNGTVYIIGAGPGAPDLIAVRAKEIIEQADLILYADSLVEHSVAELAVKSTTKIVPSSGLHLGQMIEMMVEAAKAGQIVARVHSGDPSLYGATHEQMALLDDAKVPYVIVPGITAAFAAAAELGIELTIPDVVQTIILTRTAGRTSMPSGEELTALAAPGASLAIYLSVTRMKRVIADLIASGGYTEETPIAVFHKVTWPDESYVIGTLADIADKVRKAGYTKHALLLVSPALDPELKGKDRRTSSHLYDSTYTHRFRKAEDAKRAKEMAETENPADVVFGEKHLGSAQKGIAVIAVSKAGSALAETVGREFSATVAVPAKFSPDGYNGSALTEIRRSWNSSRALILVMPTGVATRAIAPLLRNKTSDPAVIVVDEQGKWAIPLVGGHLAGANQWATDIASFLEGQAVITTASDLQGKPAIDLIAQAAEWVIDPAGALTHATASIVNGETIAIYAESEQLLAPLQEVLALDGVEEVATLDLIDMDSYTAGIIVTDEPISDHHQHLLQKSALFRTQ